MVADGGVNSSSAADGLRLIDIGLGLWDHLYSRGSFITQLWGAPSSDILMSRRSR